MKKLRATKTTGYDPAVFAKIVKLCDQESAAFNDVVNELIRRGLKTLEPSELEGEA